MHFLQKKDGNKTATVHVEVPLDILHQSISKFINKRLNTHQGSILNIKHLRYPIIEYDMGTTLPSFSLNLSIKSPPDLLISSAGTCQVLLLPLLTKSARESIPVPSNYVLFKREHLSSIFFYKPTGRGISIHHRIHFENTD